MSTNENILATVLKRVDDNKGSLDVDWPGIAFDTTSRDEWIAPRVSFVTAGRVRSGHEDRVVDVVVNCFVKRSQDAYRHFEIADTVAGWFHQADLELLYGGQGLRFEEAQIRPVPQSAPTEEGLLQVAVSIQGRLVN